MNNPNRSKDRTCGEANCGCSKGLHWTRRDFVSSLGAAAGLFAVEPWRAMAGPFGRADFERLVPADKKLRPEWLKSLTERGQREVYRGGDLEKIGMPIGGLCAGQVYIGGDGRLWHWDIFNQRIGTGAEHYAHPLNPASPFQQGFAIRVSSLGKSETRLLSREHWREVSFTGEYPIAYVSYHDSDCPVTVKLEAFSPFAPLNEGDSSLPATVLEFSVENSSGVPVEATLAGWLENAICLHSSQNRDGLRRNQLARQEGLMALECRAEEPPVRSANSRPDIVFDDFERESYAPWKATGTAFGSGPVEMARIPPYQGDVGGHGKRVVNTHASAPGTTVEERDAAKGTLTSGPFKIERDYINFLIGGGAHKNRTCMNLRVEGQVVRTATGANDNRMRSESWDVRRWAGQTGTLEIVDNETGGWGNIGIDDIIFSDSPHGLRGALAEQADFGSMALVLLDSRPEDFGCTELTGELPQSSCEGNGTQEVVKKPFGTPLVGCVGRRLKIPPGGTAKALFVIAWHMPNLKMARLPGGRQYATRFASALAVAQYVHREFARLADTTRLWHDTWYDSTLPYWFLNRTFLNTSILATSTAYQFANGRFYGWEGVGCCEGTCGHVWQYAHAVGRLFPEWERSTREKVDFGLALQPDGAIHFRGEFNDIPAIDAQAGTILRALREHQMSASDAFLRRNWPQIKRATEWLLAKDGNGDGLLEGNQHNTLDTDWFGPVAWLSGLYLAALRAAEQMAGEVDDVEFARRVRAVFDGGQKNFVAQLFDKEYFINKPDPKHADAINSGTGCEIDQVFGQSWAFQVGLPRVLPRAETVSALKSLWRYNFTPDVGPYRQTYKAGRWYAMPGEAGLLMCTFPRADWDYAQAKGKGPDWAAGYFNECMNGFEYQVAGHMLSEGLLTEGLAVTRAIHDRYHPSRRNPWNEVECGDHYARSMASYGVYLAACGFEYHGPKGHLGFAPVLRPADFKATFTAAEGWGSFQQNWSKTGPEYSVRIKWGRLRLRSLSLLLPEGPQPTRVEMVLGGRGLEHHYKVEGNRLKIALSEEATIEAGDSLEIRAV